MNHNNNKIFDKETITGLIDAEGSFGVNLIKDKTRTLGYSVTIYLEMAFNYKDKNLLDRVKATLGVGNISFNNRDKTYKWKVSSISEITKVVIPHFINYPLLSKKQADFEIFKQIALIIVNKFHLTESGLQQIINLKAALNLGLSENLKTDFPFTIPAVRPIVPKPNKISANWLLGFAEGESCFFVSVYKSPKSKQGWAIQLVFKITQHLRDQVLLESIAEFFAVGRVERRKGEACDFTVTSVSSIEKRIIPFFVEHELQGSKLLNYKDFKKVFDIVKAKGHLTADGLEQIKLIKLGMNSARDA